jgi:hypothetical protein
MKKGGRQGSRAGLGTSSGRPMTGRPMTSRPMTASVRPGTSVGGALTRGTTAGVEEDEDEYDEEEEDYESDDDGDVFAFVPRESLPICLLPTMSLICYCSARS